MLKINGLNQLSSQLKAAQKALANLDGEIGTARFDPHDPASIEAAIKRIEAIIDEKVGDDISNPIIGPLVEGMKEQYRAAIIDRAAAARLEGEKNDE